ncbi:MAG: hypothetical protein J5688_06535 [Paludibacteraceae bacterium]|nr:hypothetical protein [Paludibacteraceae bacterium]
MKKLIFTMVLAIAGGVWAISSACGVGRAPANLPDNAVTLYGAFESVPSPCYDTICSPCMTYAFHANGTLYYLSSSDEQIRQQLDIEVILPSAYATITGTTYKIESDDWLKVQSVSFGEKPKEVYHPMLAVGKQWSYLYTFGHLDAVWENGLSTMTIVEDGKTSYSESITDTVRINGIKYFVVKNLHTAAGVQPQVYMREDAIAQKVWVLPKEGDEEQLLYSFNVAIGDTLRDITFYPAENTRLILSLAKYVVTNINSTDGRKTIQLHAIVPYGPELDPEAPPFEHDFTWIEGVGEKQYGLSATWYDDDKAGGISSNSLLCVQQGDELLYVSAKGQELGCEYPASEPTIASFPDTWNCVFFSSPAGAGDDFPPSTMYHTFYLSGDTTISDVNYHKLYIDGQYPGMKGTLNHKYLAGIRVSSDAQQVYVQTNNEEYLLFDFSVNVGDTCHAYWGIEVAFSPEHFENKKVVRDLLVLSKESYNGYSTITLEDLNNPNDVFNKTTWIVGVGSTIGLTSYQDCCAGVLTPILLCASQNGQQVYASDFSKEYGCYYDSNELQGDTIKLYKRVGDDPGSSTVDPVDPNQIVVILQQDMLIMREYMGDEIQYSLQKSLASNAPAKANAPAMSKQVQADSFRGSASVQLTEDGTYRLDLTNPDWDYSIYGVFDYGTVGLDPVIPDATATKVIRNGHLFIQKGDKIFTFTGVRIE